MHPKRFIPMCLSAVGGLALALSLALVCSLSSGHGAAVAAPTAPIVHGVDPATGTNDLNVAVTIAGSGFTAGMSGSVVITQPVVSLGTHALASIAWVSDTQITASVPWGLTPGVYTLTVANPDGQVSQLPDAFTVTQGLGVWTSDGPYGGSIPRVAIHPITPTTLLANAPDVGFFRSFDGGGSWEQVSGRAGESTIAINAAGDTVIVGGDVAWYRSLPTGGTWYHMFWLDGWLRNPVAHPVSDTVYYASTNCSELHRSTDGGWTWFTWSSGITVTACEGGNTHIAFDPANPDRMYAGTPSGSIFVSDDAGANWTFASRPVSALWSMGVNPFGAHEVWVGTDNRWGDQSTGLLKSTNADLTSWTEVEEEPGTKLLWPAYIEFAPVTWGQAYSRTVFIPFGNGFRQTADGGGTWTETDLSFFMMDMALDGVNADRWVAGSETGVHVTLDGGQIWSQKIEGLSAVVADELAAAPDHPETVYAMNGSSLYASDTAGSSWRMVDTMGEAVEADPFDGGRVYLGLSAGGDTLVRTSSDGGVTWPVTGVLTVSTQYSTCSSLFEVLRADPVTPGRILAGLGHFCGDWSNVGGSLQLSVDGGAHWADIALTEPMSQVNDIAFESQSPATVVAGTFKSGVFTSTDSGATWHAAGGAAAGKNIGSVAAEPAEPYRLYAAAQYDTGVYRSDDGGATWTEVASPPSQIGRRGLAVLPGDPQVLYAATKGGLFRSDDGATTWMTETGSLGRVPAHALAVATDEGRSMLYVGTAGGIVTAAHRAAVAEDVVVDAGVYRATSRLVTEYRVYLPLVIR